jgi:hypothetical protein
MSVQLIGENILKPSHTFTTSVVGTNYAGQDGEKWGAAEPDTDNEGNYRVKPGGTPDNLYYIGQTTADGAVDKTTLIDSVLCCYGDDYLIGATIIVGSDTRTCSDFAQATGTITVSSAFTNRVMSATAFTLTLPFSTRDYKVELIASGDAGTGTYKWSHDGGATYFGRHSPNTATWLNKQVIDDTGNATAGKNALIDLGENGVLAIYSDSDGVIKIKKTVDNGITWTQISSSATADDVGAAIRLRSGRILLVVSTTLYYSDDEGVTWATGPTVSAFTGLAEISSNVVIGVYGTLAVSCKLSYDAGMTWSTAVTVASTTNTQAEADICVAENGDLVCVYYSDEDGLGSDEIKCKISTDHGMTWGSVIAVIDFTTDVRHPTIARDINGDLYVVADQADADQPIVMSRSTDNGATWSTGSILTVATTAGKDFKFPSIALVAGHQMWCLFHNDTDNDITLCRAGVWAAYSANACPCAMDAISQHLACGAWISWHGGEGVAGDIWTFEADYDFAASNMVVDSPSKCWKVMDDYACYCVIDLGSELAFADTVAFFGCNARSFKFQMNDSDSWGAPAVNVSVSFDVTTSGALDALIVKNEIKDSSLLANYQEHSLKDYYVCFTSGTLDDYTFQIKDNVGDYLLCYEDINALEAILGNAAVNDTFAIYKDRVVKSLGNEYAYRYIRIYLDDVYRNMDGRSYKIGTMIVGKGITLTDSFGVGYELEHNYGVKDMLTPGGGRIPIKNYGRRRSFSVSFNASETGRKELVALLDYMEGSAFALVLDSSNLLDCHLVHLDGPIELEQVYLDKFSLNAEFTEVL